MSDIAQMDVVERLTIAIKRIEEKDAEIERLRKICKGWYDQNTDLIQQRDKVWRENQQLRARNAELLAALDTCAVPTPEQREEMETGFGAVFTPRAALELGMKTAIGNVRRAIAKAVEGE
jgi:hypothetical protein